MKFAKHTHTLFAVLIACCLAAGLLAGCGDNTPPAAPVSSVPAPASVAAPESVPAPPPAEESAPAESASAAGYDLEAILAVLVEQAQLGNTIKMSQIDLQAGGVDVANVAAFAGAEAQTYADNGGIVVLIQTQPGMAGTVAAEMENFRESRMDDRYAEFATQLENTKNGSLVSFPDNDIVIFAVSAVAHEGDGQARLAAAIDALDLASYAV